MRRSLETVGRFLTDSAQSAAKGSARPQHGVLTPAARVRPDSAKRSARDGDAAAPAGRITDPLRTVVTRARWKASACRLSAERCDIRAGRGEPGERDPLEVREGSLRVRLKTLPDTSTWMLDMPFGKRLSDPDALDVTEEQTERLRRVAECYDAVAAAAEVAIELDDAGAFAKGPPPQFLYLMAEAQSALLQSLASAPTRVDSDQRDMFLWLKDQTTHYRIYVDRFMRLDDPADPTQASDILERIRRSARDVVAEQKQQAKRRELLSKVRYHAKKVGESSALSTGEVDSLEQALKAWSAAGLERTDRRIQETLSPLRASETEGAAGEALAQCLAPFFPAPKPRTSEPSAQGGETGEGRDPVTAEDVRASLASRSVGILVDVRSEIDLEGLREGLGVDQLVHVGVDLEGSADARNGSLDELLAADADVFLLGVKLPSEEYGGGGGGGRFKEACLARGVLFVRLPGPLEPDAVLHQVARQVGWRLRARARS